MPGKMLHGFVKEIGHTSNDQELVMKALLPQSGKTRTDYAVAVAT